MLAKYLPLSAAEAGEETERSGVAVRSWRAEGEGDAPAGCLTKY